MFADSLGEQSPEPVDPEADTFVAVARHRVHGAGLRHCGAIAESGCTSSLRVG